MTIIASRSMSTRSSMAAVRPRLSIGETLLRARSLLGSTSKNMSRRIRVRVLVRVYKKKMNRNTNTSMSDNGSGRKEEEEEKKKKDAEMAAKRAEIEANVKKAIQERKLVENSS
mmetsp:Transcript_9364/g.13540  ORF Transcript_9364/g.13540 Transcript_9364/m.13540 type:complete len:114 (-) Transcript_9364:165-506(-)